VCNWILKIKRKILSNQRRNYLFLKRQRNYIISIFKTKLYDKHYKELVKKEKIKIKKEIMDVWRYELILENYSQACW